MLAVVLGLASGLSWGVADFLGGLASRRAAALSVVAVSQTAGLAIILVVLGVARPAMPPASHLLFGVAAGVAGVVGLAAFYRALAIGSMSLVAPVSALGALVPVAIDLIGGGVPGAVLLLGMAAALAGGSLAARAPGPATRRGLGLALVAAAGFGGFFALLAQAADDSTVWALVASRSASAPLALIAVAVVGAGLRVPPRVALLAVAGGTLDLTANILFAAGSQRGLLSVVAVLGSLYPVATIALAGVVLKERMGRAQAAGVALAVCGVALIAAG